ncbi:unnamed protein product, partial [marine sediment metagenome]
MEQVIFGGWHELLETIGIRYLFLSGGCPPRMAESTAKGIVSTGGKIKNLRVKLDGSPGTGKKYTFTLLLNAAPSALTLEIADTATSGADTTHEVDVVAGDYVSLRCEPTNTPTARYATWTSMFEGSTAKESLLLANSDGWLVDSAGVRYAQASGYSYPRSTDENEARQVCPTSG